jgi:hypothetical protein
MMLGDTNRGKSVTIVTQSNEFSMSSLFFIVFVF